MDGGGKFKSPANQNIVTEQKQDNSRRAELIIQMHRHLKEGEWFSDADLDLIHDVLRMERNDENKFVKRVAETLLFQLGDTNFDALKDQWKRLYGEKLERPAGPEWETPESLGYWTKRRAKKRRRREEIKNQLRTGNIEVLSKGAQQRLFKLMDDARNSVATYEDSARTLVGYEDVRERIAQSVQYWVIKDKEFRKMWDAVSRGHPPPQVFVLKGSSGSGKTTLAEAAMYDATMRALKNYLPVWSHQIHAHETLVKWIGESERNLAKSIDAAFQHPSIILFDEMQALARFIGSGGGDDPGNVVMGRMNDVLAKKINEIKGKRSIAIFATNQFGSISEPIKRRAVSGTFDLDERVDHNMLVKVAKRNMEKYRITGIDPDELVTMVEKKVRSLGHASVTPADIANVFAIVIGKKMENVYAAVTVSNAGGKVQGNPVEITMQDFKSIANLKEYSEGERSEELRKILTRIKPKITLADVGGLDAVKGQLYQDVRMALDYEAAEKAGSKPIHGVLLWGPPGTGKTWLVQAVCGELNAGPLAKGKPVEIFMFNGSQVFSKYYGETGRVIRDVFDEARKNAPAVIFIDEIEALALSRGSEINSSPIDGVTTLLSEMDGQKPLKGVVVIGTTNRPGMVDEALKRSGRFDRILEIPPPTNDTEKMDMINVHLRKARDSIDSTVTPKSVLDLFGRKTFTPAAIEGMISGAVQLRLKEIGAAQELSQETISADNPRLDRIWMIYADAAKRLYSNLGLPGAPPNSAKDITPEFAERMKGVSPDSYKLTITHFKAIADHRDYEVGERHEELSKILTRIKPKITLADVGGLDAVKGPLYQDVRMALDYEAAQKAGSKPIHGVLLWGPPGTGKTWLVQAICGELNAGPLAKGKPVEILMFNGSQVFNKYYGETGRAIRDIFEEARKNAPAVIFIDEIEALALSRGSEINSSPIDGVTTLLSEMDGQKSLEGVIVIGTTNRPDMVDDALKRSGRFDRIVEIPPPRNDTEKMEIIGVHLRKSKDSVDSTVTPQSVLDLFGKKMFTPAAIEGMVSSAVQLRLKEIGAAQELSQETISADNPRLDRIWMIYADAAKRLYSNLGLPGAPPNSAKDITPEFAERMKGISPDSYKLTITHFKTAMAAMQNPGLEEIRKLMEGLRSGATVGKVYGLAAMPDGRGGGQASEGMVLAIECVLDPEGLRPGTANVIGSEVDESIKASANHGRVFLNAQSGYAIRQYEFSIEVVTAAKGLDQKAIQGPSAGAAITLAEYSSITGEKVLPNVVVTGGITQLGEIFKVGGLDYKGAGKIMAAQNTKGVDTMVIPRANYEDFPPEELAKLARQGLNIVPASTFWDVLKVALESHPDEQQAIQRLKDAARLRKEPEAVAAEITAGGSTAEKRAAKLERKEG